MRPWCSLSLNRSRVATTPRDSPDLLFEAIMPGDGDETFVSGLATGSREDGGSEVKPVRRFTWRELSKLNEPHNAHVAVRGKVWHKRM